LEGELRNLDAQIARVEAQIARVEAAIQAAEEKANAATDTEERDYWRLEELQLREKGNLLRKEGNQLRKEGNQLRAEQIDLRKLALLRGTAGASSRFGPPFLCGPCCTRACCVFLSVLSNIASLIITLHASSPSTSHPAALSNSPRFTPTARSLHLSPSPCPSTSGKPSAMVRYLSNGGPTNAENPGAARCRPALL
jgi:hypothetical protein